VATWAWPTWVVSRRRVLEAAFVLLEFSSPSRRIFIGSHSLPPLWFAVSVLHAGPSTGRPRRCWPRRRKCSRTPGTGASPCWATIGSSPPPHCRPRPGPTRGVGERRRDARSSTSWSKHLKRCRQPSHGFGSRPEMQANTEILCMAHLSRSSKYKDHATLEVLVHPDGQTWTVSCVEIR
jgi:hypothetical protein